MAPLNRREHMVRDERGQATVEYILLISIVVSLFVILADGIGKAGLMTKLMGPLSGDYAHAYRYGHPKALGYDDGGPKKHPRWNTNGSNDNFRIFYVRTW